MKILLISHAHWDHNAGSAKIKQLTGATYMVMEGDVAVVESGGKSDFQYGSDAVSHVSPRRVSIACCATARGRARATPCSSAHLTPGHTKGCTTWTMRVRDGGATYNAVDHLQPERQPGIQAGRQHGVSHDRATTTSGHFAF